MLNNVKTFVLMAGLTALLMGAGAMLGGRGGVTIALGLAVLMNFVGYWFSDKIALAMSHAEEVGPHQAPELYEIVATLAEKAALPMPRVYVIPELTPNAFATGRSPEHAAVAVTEGILRLLSWEELEGVIAHELAHVKHRDILIGSVAAMLAGALTQLAHMAQWAAMFGFGRDDDDSPAEVAGGVAMMVLGPIAAMLVQMAISRSREFEADRAGAQLCGNPLALASALTKLERGAVMRPMATATPATAHMYIVNPLTASRFLMKLFSTHPPTEERVARLEAMVAQRYAYGA